KLIGIGNDCRGDDYVGLYIIGKLQEILPSQSTVDLLVFNNRDTSELFELWEPTDKIYMFDAIQADDTVGKIVKIDLNQMNLPEEISRTSSHTLNMKEIVELTKLMKGSPQQWLFWGIVGQFF